jgi:hypothetical protein
MKKTLLPTAGDGQLTVAPVAAPGQVAAQPVLPEFIRLPKPGTLCAWTGLSRTKMNELVLPNKTNGFRPRVKSVCLRQAGQKKGARLIHLAGLIAYLHSQGNGSEPVRACTGTSRVGRKGAK